MAKDSQKSSPKADPNDLSYEAAAMRAYGNNVVEFWHALQSPASNIPGMSKEDATYLTVAMLHSQPRGRKRRRKH